MGRVLLNIAKSHVQTEWLKSKKQATTMEVEEMSSIGSESQSMWQRFRHRKRIKKMDKLDTYIAEPVLREKLISPTILLDMTHGLAEKQSFMSNGADQIGKTSGGQHAEDAQKHAIEWTLAYRRRAEMVYKQLSQMARKYLTIPATSTPCELLFSKVDYFIPAARNRLKSGILKQSALLDSWLKYEQNQPLAAQLAPLATTVDAKEREQHYLDH